MRIVVIGGTGLIGRLLVRQLAAQGHVGVAASPTTGVNTVTRIGLDDALVDADVVVDVGDPPSFDDDAVLDHFVTSGRNLAHAETAAGVAHHITLSVLGADRLPDSGYMRAKLAQEAATVAGGVPFTILRSAQSFELLRSVADAATDGGMVRISPATVQPVAACDIAGVLADLAGQRAAGTTLELAGPAPIRLVDVVDAMLRAQHDSRRTEAAPDVPYYGSRLDDQTLLPGPEARLGTVRLEDWIARNVAPEPLHLASGATN